MKDEIKTGVFTIENQILKINNRTINISNIDNMETFPLEKYPLSSGVWSWIKAWIVLLIIMCIFFSDNTIAEFLFAIYTISIILLLIYNYKKHQEQLYVLIITTSRTKLNIVSDNNDFLNNVHDILKEAMNSKKVNCTINLDNRVINNGIISKGNNNKNKVNKIDNNN